MPQIKIKQESSTVNQVDTENEKESSSSDDEEGFVEFQSLLAHKIIERTSQPLIVSSSGFPFEMSKNKRVNKNEPKYIKRRKRHLDSISFYLKILIICLIITTLLVLVKKVMFHSSDSNVDDMSVVQYNNLLHVKDIKGWCLNGMHCKCSNPLIPKDKIGYKTWSTAHSYNILQCREVAALIKKSNRLLDVIFLGDSITEGWIGRSFGVDNPVKKDNYPVFQSYFQTRNSQRYGMALGIAGDKSPNLLWRIQNEEILLPELQPRVYWVLIGTNDFNGGLFDSCSHEVIYMGIVRVIEELKQLIVSKSTSASPRPKIVIQALLPRADDTATGNLYPPELSKIKINRYKAIVTINNKLHHYCMQPEHIGFIYYQNLNDIFIAKRNNPDHIVINENVAYSDYYIPQNLMYDFLHPTALGYKMLAQRIIKELDRII